MGYFRTGYYRSGVSFTGLNLLSYQFFFIGYSMMQYTFSDLWVRKGTVAKAWETVHR